MNPGKRLLIVDDSPAIRKSVVRTVQRIRLFREIFQARDGVEGYQIALQQQVDLMIVDLIMPRMDGLKLLCSIRKLEAYRSTPIILLSTQRNPRLKARALQEGANDYVTKPFQPPELLARIRNLLTMRELQQELLSKNQALEQTNQRLEELSLTDDLTGLWNRRYLWVRIEEELDRARRYGTPLACLMIDVDDFKKINDTFGHIIGDRVLTELTRVLKAQCRRHHLIARFGGEEFLILLDQTDSASARNLARRILTAVSQHPFPIAEQTAPLWLTISIGLASLPDPEIQDATDLIKKADQCLYRAKQLGKNRIECDR